jgi:hypothetical protein
LQREPLAVLIPSTLAAKPDSVSRQGARHRTNQRSLMPEPDGPTGEELRARYADQTTMVDTEMVLQLLGRDDIDPKRAVAFRYATPEAYGAFAEANRRHHGHETLEPVAAGDGAVYGLTILSRQQ